MCHGPWRQGGPGDLWGNGWVEVSAHGGRAMTEGEKVTAAAARDPGAGASAGSIADAHTAPAGPAQPGPAPAGPAPAGAAPAAPATQPGQAGPPGQEPAPGPGAPQAAEKPAAQEKPGAPEKPGAQEKPQSPQVPGIEPHVRVDGRLLESAILALRKPIVAASLPLE